MKPSPKQLLKDAAVGFGGSRTELSRETGIPLRTLQNFASGTNDGSRALIVLLHILANHPEVARGLCEGIQ